MGIIFHIPYFCRFIYIFISIPTFPVSSCELWELEDNFSTGLVRYNRCPPFYSESYRYQFYIYTSSIYIIHFQFPSNSSVMLSRNGNWKTTFPLDISTVRCNSCPVLSLTDISLTYLPIHIYIFNPVSVQNAVSC